MKNKLLSVLVISNFIVGGLSFGGVCANAKQISYEPSKEYTYTYKTLNNKGKVIYTDVYSIVRKGDMKGVWKIKGLDFYKSYGKYGLDMVSGTYAQYQRGAIVIENLLPSNNPKKGEKGILNQNPYGNEKYRILSTNALAKTKNKTYTNTIKIWTNTNGNTVRYYAKNIGLVKEQHFEHGEYRTSYYLHKITK